MTFEQLRSIISKPGAPKLCTDSRSVRAGDIFLAIKGSVFDGHDFIGQAIENGAKFIVAEKGVDCKTAELVLVADCAEAAAVLAQSACGEPADKLTNLAVTGTNGKTTVTFLARSIIQSAGKKCGLIGTIVYDTSQVSHSATLTTPDSLHIASKQEQMVEAGAKYMVIEASSHALGQNRLAGIDFKAAAFTNLTGDHLDYHQTKENYLAAKILLFKKLSPDRTAVLNKQSPEAKVIAENTKAKVLWYAIDEPADIGAHIESMDITGSVFSLDYAGQKQKVKTTLPGRYNISNCLAAAGMCLAAGFDLSQVAAGIGALRSVPGRLEKVDWPGDFTVLIDYAHTDDALKNVLSTVKPLCKGKLTVVFGCGGDRDKTKRPRMAQAVEQWADNIIVTSDNPRTEHAAAILGEIAVGFESLTAVDFEIERERAIELAITNARKDDIVLIAGKGHEDYQIIGTEKIDFSDFEVAKKYLAKLK